MTHASWATSPTFSLPTSHPPQVSSIGKCWLPAPRTGAGCARGHWRLRPGAECTHCPAAVSWGGSRIPRASVNCPNPGGLPPILVSDSLSPQTQPKREPLLFRPTLAPWIRPPGYTQSTPAPVNGRRRLLARHCESLAHGLGAPWLTWPPGSAVDWCYHTTSALADSHMGLDARSCPPRLGLAAPGPVNFLKSPSTRLRLESVGRPELRGPFKGRGRVAGPPPPRGARRPVKGTAPTTPARRELGWRARDLPAGRGGEDVRPSIPQGGPPHHVHHHQGAQQAGRAAPHRAHAAASGEQARRAPEVPAARAAHSAAPAGAASGTLAPIESRAKACVQSSEWPEAPYHIPIHRGDPGDLHAGPRGECPLCVRSLAASGATAGWWPSR